MKVYCYGKIVWLLVLFNSWLGLQTIAAKDAAPPDTQTLLPGSITDEPDQTQIDSLSEDQEGDAPTWSDTIVVTASRNPKELADVPYTTTVITADVIRAEQQARSTPEILAAEPSVMVQKSGRGQGSPYLRGFTGFRTLFMIDGIRLNNATFRDGPNQYWSTVDPFAINRLELVKGPSSVLYGSDAIGGTVNALSRDLDAISELGKNNCIYYRFGSADLSSVGNLDLNGTAGTSLRYHVGGSAKHYDNLQGGKDVGEQPKTGYDENAADLKLQLHSTDNDKLILGFQHAALDDAWRTHSTVYGISWQGTSSGSDRKRIFDQGRELGYLQYYKQHWGPFFENFGCSFSFQQQTEDEYRVKSDLTSEQSTTDVRSLGFWSQVGTPIVRGRLTYGLEFYRDLVDTARTKYDAEHSVTSREIQGPVADDATYDLLGVFLQAEVPFSAQFELTSGLRYTFAHADARKVKDPVSKAAIALDQHWDDVSASVRCRYRLLSTWSLYGGASQGFRAPNLSDLTRLDIARSDELETPSPDLEPEKFTTFELGASATMGTGSGTLALFYTDIQNMIIRYPTGTMIDGSYEVQKSNVGNGYVYGVEAAAQWRIAEKLMFSSAIAWMRGDVDTYPTAERNIERRPVSRILPLNGTIGLRWQPFASYWLESNVKIAARQDRLSPDDARDTQRIPPGGTPGYMVWTLNGGAIVSEYVSLSAAIENIGDVDYRIHGSGINEPGRNVVVTAAFKF